MVFASKRLARELCKLQEELPPGITLVQAEDLKEWLMDIRVIDDNPIYRNEIYRLKFTFSSSYPIEPPEVVFQQLSDRPIPLHPHIYSNGYICLDLLGRSGWSPVQNVESVCVSLQSMLTGNTKRERPPGNDDFVSRNRLRPRDVDFYYHDNTVWGTKGYEGRATALSIVWIMILGMGQVHVRWRCGGVTWKGTGST